MPRWLLLMLLGVLIGAGGVIFVQQRYLPPRLSASESTQLRETADRAEAERARLSREAAESAKRLDAALAESKGMATELSASKEAADRLRGDVSSLVASLPPDPRGSPIAVRAARFEVTGDSLVYDVVLSRDGAKGRPVPGVLQFVVAGASGRSDDTVSSKPIAVSVGIYDSVRGSLPLPQGFKPRQTTINVLDKPGGKLLGMRVMYVK
ncbi:MAG: hypothetical protein ABIV63_21540 [Caldimonas sp.]